jgi:hypothetical protein
MRGHLFGNDPDKLAEKKLAAIRERDYQLQNAWRSPGIGRTDPNNAAESERLRRQVTHEAP